ncbi:rod shape-determining protein MreC [Streptomyces yaizuensis]|uniref:Cell shape-determining protein MreC n=1 Tax=Streptomyces yaizuensis TaxID=2989713 RepID=A0ABQ5NTL6_9ACTN|nr:rod shape-determining protein MreC [Streptomyces sp. YSPA8]GLF93716.1 rod shape-determining protein MreC [Streptomyces sp. YSPA8]
MRDTRESRLLLVLLIAIAFALITVDIRGGEDSPLDGARQAAATVFGPVEKGVATAVDPVGNAIAAVRDSGERHDRVTVLERENAELRARLGSDDRNRSRARELDRILRTAGAGQYGIKGAQVIAIGAAQGFSWTVTLDIGSQDGVERDMTVLNGDGLVGRITTVGPHTSTVLLAIDPDFAVGTRLEKSDELGFANGQGARPLSVQLFNGKHKVKKGDRLVTFGSHGNRPFVPGVPIGEVVRVDPSGGGLTRTIHVEPYAGFSKLDIVGVVVQAPRTDPRDTVLPPKPRKPQPVPTVTVTVTPGATLQDGTEVQGGTGADARDGTGTGVDAQGGRDALDSPAPGLTPGPVRSPAAAASPGTGTGGDDDQKNQRQ